MIIYNVTLLISESKEQEFVQWMQNEHIQDVLDTKLFTKAIFLKLLTEVGDTEGVTYAVQYYCESKDKLQEYYKKYAPSLRQKGLTLFGENMLGFRTELEIIQESQA